MEQKLAKTRTELLEAQEEVTCLRIQVRDHSSKLLEVQRKLELEKQRVTELTGQKEELQLLHQLLSTELQGLREEVKTVQDNKVELWHTNCQQLLTHDEEMSEKEREIKVLCDRLHRTEMELATLKLEKLSEGTQSSVSQSIYGISVGFVLGGASVNPLGPFGQDYKPMVATLPVQSAGSVGRVTTTPLFQSGIYTTALYAQSTLPRVLPSIQYIYILLGTGPEGWMGWLTTHYIMQYYK